MPRIRTEMPPSLLPDREQEICARFRRVRQDHRFKQEEFADILAISIARLKSYEYARAPIKYGLAKRLIDDLGTDPDWLATGTGEQRSRVSIAPEYDFWIPPKMSYSFVYDRLLKGLLEEERNISTERGNRRRRAGSQDEEPFPSGSDQSAMMQVLANAISGTFSEYCAGLSEENTLRVIRRIAEIIGPINKTRWATIKEALKTKSKRIEKHELIAMRDLVFQKLDLSQDGYRALNISEGAESHEDLIALSKTSLKKIKSGSKPA